MKIYLLKEYNFDNMENNYHSALAVKILGYKKSLEEAGQYIEGKVKNDKTYKGWDKKYYPRYSIDTVEEII